MPNSKASKMWMTNVSSFILFVVLSFTGLINWLILPRGYEVGSGWLISLRHFFREVHEWSAFLFIITIIIHMVLHLPYIKSNLKKYGILK